MAFNFLPDQKCCVFRTKINSVVVSAVFILPIQEFYRQGHRTVDNSDRLLFKSMQDGFQCRDGKINMDCCVSAGAHTAGIKTKMKKRKEKTRDKCRCKNIVEIRFFSLFFNISVYQRINNSLGKTTE